MESDQIDDEHAELAALTARAEQQRRAPDWLWWLLDTTIHNSDQLDELARRSTHHPNGFVRIALVPEGLPRLRLHIWPSVDSRQPDAGHPHGHRWPFASWVITGSLRETTYAERRDGEPFTEYAYAGAGERLPHSPSRQVLLAATGTATRSADIVYTRRTGEMHIATPATDDLVATLVVQGGDRVATTPVYRRPGAPPPQRNRPIRTAELQALLDAVLKVLEPVS